MLYVTAGTKIRAFTLTECLGKGGMSAVWKAHHAETGQDYALKILHGSVVDDEQARLRFFEEGLIQSRVTHPNVVAVKGRIEEHPVHALVMEYVEGPALSTYVSERPGGLYLAEVKAIATGILSGLNAAHRRGIIHRDVKPSNVLLARDFYTITPKLTDFGIAKVKYGRLKTVTGNPMGTPHFMSPEQLRDSKRVTLETDIYSFGVTLYHMVSGQLPYDGDDLNALMLKIVQGGHQPPSSYRDTLPPELDELIERCMAPRPQDRPENCREVLEAILAIDWNQPEAAAPAPAARRKAGSGRRAAPRSEAPKPAAGRVERHGTTEGRRVARPPTPPPLPAAARPAPERGAGPTKAPPASRPSVPVAAIESGEWRMSSEMAEDIDLDAEEAALHFKRRSWVPLAIAVIVLIALGAFGTRFVLDYLAAQRAQEESQTATEADQVIEQGVEQGVEAVVGTEAANAARGVEQAAGGSGEPSGEPSIAAAGLEAPPTQTSAGSGEAAAVTATADAALADTAPPEAIVAAEPVEVAAPAEPASAEPAEDATLRLAAAGAPAQSAVLNPTEPEEAAPALLAAAESAEAPAVAAATPTRSTESTESAERPSSRSEQRDTSTRDPSPSGPLVGREAERAAEEAWRSRQGSAGSEVGLAPTIHATGPQDDPTAQLGGTIVTPTPTQTQTQAQPPEQGDEQLSPVQVNRVIAARRSQLRACFEGFDSPPIEMRLRITPEGRVSFARALEGGANGQVVGCLVRELGGLQFDAFDGSAMNIRRTFSRVGPM